MKTNSMTIPKFFSTFFDMDRKGFMHLDHYALQTLMGTNLILAKEHYKAIRKSEEYRLNRDALIASGQVLAIVDSKNKVEYYITPVTEIVIRPIEVTDVNANIEDLVVKKIKRKYTKEDLDKFVAEGRLTEIATYILYECLNIRTYGYKTVKLIKKELSNRGVSLDRHPAYKRMQKAPAEIILDREEKEMTYVKHKRGY